MAEWKTAGTLFIDNVPDVVRDWVAERAPGETVWGALETGSDREEGDVWLVATDARNALVAASKSGRWWTDLPLTGKTTTSTRFAKRFFELDEESVFEGLRVGNADLERLFELAFQPRGVGLRTAADDHIHKRRWAEAEQLLELASDAAEDDDHIGVIAYLSPAQQITMRRAQCALEDDRGGEAIEFLQSVSAEREDDDLIDLTKQWHGTEGWILSLALAHEEAGDARSAARVYQRLSGSNPDQDLYLLSQARAHRRAEQFDASLESYAKFIERRSSEAFSLVRQPDPDPDNFDGDADLSGACLESAQILEELGRQPEAAARYVTLIRNAPFHRPAYERLFALRDALEEQHFTVAVAGQVFRLLMPVAAQELDVPAAHEPVELPHQYTRIETAEHDATLVHRGERQSTSVVQKWLGWLTNDERGTEDIERHAQRIDGSRYPEALAILHSVARLLDVEPPRLFLSHGSSGVDVLGTEEPFVLLGACHLDIDDPRHLETRELAFALASQVEHIKAGHLILTSSEFWKTFGTKSATTLLAFVPMGDIIGRFTDVSVLKWVDKLRTSTEASSRLRSLLDIAEKRVAEGGAREGVQSAYTAALAQVRNVTLDDEAEEVDRPSMVKEQLADFARAAQYTADRAGLLACDDLSTAVGAVLRLSPTASAFADQIEANGLLDLVSTRNDDGELVYEELVLRCGELIKFALSAEYAKLREQVLSTR